MALTPEEQQRLLDLTTREIELLRQRRELTEEEEDFLRRKLELQNNSVESIRNEVEQYERYVNALRTAGESRDANNLRLDASIKLEQARLDLELRIAQENGTITKELLEQQSAAQQNIAAAKQVLDVQESISNEINQQSSGFKRAEERALKLMVANKQGLSGALALRSALNLVDTGADAFIGKLVESARSVFVAFNESTTAFEKQFAVGEDYKAQITDIYQELDVFGVSIEDVTKAQGDLITIFTDFTFASDEQRESLTKTANLLQRGYGVAFSDFAKGTQTSTKALGMSTKQAETFQLELAETAKAIGVPASQLSAQFAAMGPNLAKFGAEGGKAFKEVARLSKITGMEISKVLSITERFDTFEGAAERAGMLNAALGGNFVNAMDLMMSTDPAERFMMIRDAIDQTGLSFDEMGYYQRIFFAEAAGLENVNDLALLMSGNMDLLTGATNQNAASIEEQAKRAADMQTIMEALKIAFIDLVGPIVQAEDGIKELANSFRDNIRMVGGLVLAYKSLTLILAVISARRKMRAAEAIISLANSTREITQIQTHDAALNRNTTSLETNTAARIRNRNAGGVGPAANPAAAFGTAASILATAAALFALGKSFELMTIGVDRLAGAFEKLDNEKISGLNTTLGLLGGTLVLFGIGLVFAGASATASAKGIATLGGIIAGVALSIGIAAAGIGAMGLGLAELYKAIDSDKTTSFVALMAAIGVFAYTGVGLVGAASFVALGVGLAFTARSLAFISESKLSSLATFTESLTNLETEGLSKLAETITKIAEAMAKIPEEQSTLLEAMVSTTAASALVIAEANRTGALEKNVNNRTATQSLAKTNNGVIGEIKITFDSDLFNDTVVQIIENEEGIKVLESLNGRGGVK